MGKEEIFIIITFMYSIASIITFAGYIPTIKDLWHKKPSSNPTTYIMWTFTTMTSSIYGMLIIKNFIFCVNAIAQFFACITIVALTFRLKLQKRILVEDK